MQHPFTIGAPGILEISGTINPKPWLSIESDFHYFVAWFCVALMIYVIIGAIWYDRESRRQWPH